MMTNKLLWGIIAVLISGAAAAVMGLRHTPKGDAYDWASRGGVGDSDDSECANPFPAIDRWETRAYLQAHPASKCVKYWYWRAANDVCNNPVHLEDTGETIWVESGLQRWAPNDDVVDWTCNAYTETVYKDHRTGLYYRRPIFRTTFQTDAIGSHR